MKNSKNLLILFAFLVSTGALAQQHPYKPYPDSIRIEFADQKAIAVFELQNFRRDKNVIKDFPLTLAGLLEHIRKSIPEQELNDPHTITVVYHHDGKNDRAVDNSSAPREVMEEIIIQKTEAPVTEVTIKNNAIVQLLTPGTVVTIKSKLFLITLYAQDFVSLNALTSENLEPVISTIEANDEFKYQGRKGLCVRMVYQNHAIAFNKIEHQFAGDLLGFHPGAGVGIFRDNIYPEFNASIAVYLANRFNKISQRIELTYELKFFTGKTIEGGFQTQTNSFLNLSYARNFARERPRWTAIGVGYLLHANGTLYTGKTMKFFLASDIGNSKLNLVPEFYLTDDFKKFAFGLKLNYKF
jgi:hypothetical protein